MITILFHLKTLTIKNLINTLNKMINILKSAHHLYNVKIQYSKNKIKKFNNFNLFNINQKIMIKIQNL